MKFLSIRIAVCFFVLFLGVFPIRAQQFKWVAGGGSTYNFSTFSDGEQVRYMCTDPNGNIYVESNVGPTSISADTFHESAGNFNTLVTSYSCNGQMRWAKLIYATTENCYPTGIAADSLGNIYVAGTMPPSTGVLHIGYDATISGTAYDYEQMGLIQFDTSGTYHWIRFVGQNTSATGYGTPSYFGACLKVDAMNNVHYFDYMKSGVPITSSVTSVYGTYDLVYNSSGALLSQTRLDLDSTWAINDAAIDPISNKLYVTGEINQYIYGGILTDTFYAAAFDASRNRLWQYYCNDDGALTGITMDKERNLLFSGSAQGGTTGPIRFVFNRDSTIAGASGDLGIVMKTDTTGTVKWMTRFDSYISVNALFGITLLNNNKVACTGTCAGAVKCGTDSVVAEAGQYPYVVIVDSAGDVQAMQGLLIDGFYNGGTAITSDKIGNIYIGGEVSDSVWSGGIPAYHTVGGNSDFFIMKDGIDCNCTSMPIASYTDTGAHTVGVTYTGTTTGIDSVVWNFGDGSALVTGATALHTYTATSTYRVCVTVYTNCGNDIYCSNVRYGVTTVVPELSKAEVYVFPNPAMDELNVTGIQQTTSYRLLAVTGACVSQGVLQSGSNAVSVRRLATGVYVLEMVGDDGNRKIVRVVKE